MKLKGIIFVIIQVSCIILLLFFVEISLSVSINSVFHLGGFLLGIWAIWEIRISKLSIFPEVRSGARLVQTGPFKVIRHPMYTALLLFFLPTQFVVSGIIAPISYGVLIVNLVWKMKYEEALLKKEFSNYEQYSKESFHLVPYIY